MLQVKDEKESPKSGKKGKSAKSKSPASKGAAANGKAKSTKSANGAVVPAVSEKKTANEHVNPSWGRFNSGTWLGVIGCGGIIAICPVLVILINIALFHFHGSLIQVFLSLYNLGPTAFTIKYAPHYSQTATLGYVAWVVGQIVLYMGLPAKICYGQQTPAGHLLPYHINGLSAWVVSHAAYAIGSYYGVIHPALIARNWEGLIVAFNMYGFVLPLFAYVKAHLAPTHLDDRKFSGSIIYDYYMGIEFNPRIGKWFDFKLFHNGRPGIVMWTLINLSFAAYQYELHGYITKSMIVVNILHAYYVIDFFINEDWYLRTIDICHDHYGFYLAWGSMVWLPTTYTLQAQYLARNPYDLSNMGTAILLTTGTLGYVVFRLVNNQKDLARRTQGDCLIWGKKAEVIKAKYNTADGKEHETILLCSGWWGVVRHANYLGDLILSYSECAAAGLAMYGGTQEWTFTLLPWTYAIFMTILLIQRCIRDEERCSGKYGKTWDEYCNKVRWRLIPGVF
ncbi:ergosterol biosynthesis ERG4/ERG24 family-domain-containing protein [Pyronema omphalodes]|nr:ergosterol biosynthesis ERG4/ERG24 family-domain-containing protein [Pyronema omphalodes]